MYTQEFMMLKQKKATKSVKQFKWKSRRVHIAVCIKYTTLKQRKMFASTTLFQYEDQSITAMTIIIR